jgi:hypothetical protein
MENTGQQIEISNEARDERNARLLEFANRPDTTEDQRDSIRSFIVNEELNRLLAD